MRDARRAVAVIAVLGLVATACGGRLSDDQVAAELASDAVTLGGGVAVAGGNGVGTSSGPGSPLTPGDSSFDPTLVDDGTFSGSGTGTGTGIGTDSNGTVGGGVSQGGTDAPAPPAPSGGNGGATDVGVTASEVVIGNVTTLSGPVPGLFRGALVGTQAWFAYQNSLGGLHGRTFRVESGDDGFDAGKNRAAVKSLKDKVFAFNGSFSLFDAAGVADMEANNIPDVGRALSPQRQDMPNHYSMVPFGIGWPSTGCDWLKARFGDAVIKNMAIFWGNADAARDNAFWQRNACEKVGFEFVYEREIQATESNFTADVIEMRRRGVQGYFIVFDSSGIARFMKDMESQDFNPPLAYPSPAAYDSALVKLAGSAAVEGAIIGQNMSMFLGEDAAIVPEITLFQQWLSRIDPNQKVDLFALYGWSAGRLLTQAMQAAGPEVTRAKVLAQLAQVHDYNGNGLHASHDVGAKKPSVCEMYMQYDGGQFRRVFPARGFHCQGSFTPYTG